MKSELKQAVHKEQVCVQGSPLNVLISVYGPLELTSAGTSLRV